MILKTKTRALILSCLAATLTGCNDAPEGTNRAANSAATSSSPAAERPVEGANLDAEIQRLEKLVERNPGEDSVTRPLAAAYVRRGNNLRASNDLRGALKDYRSAIKYDEDNEEAQKNIAEIVPQVEGEKTGEYGEPAPLPITPNVTTDTDDNAGPSPTAQPSPRKNVNRE
ncbi:MAG TPA: tetratricopeptide repeat protein [Pyrinomonadaceae bacterium]